MTDDLDTRVDLSAGVAVGELADGGAISGRVGQDDVILVRSGASIYAVAAHCTHYGGSLAAGLVVNATVRCPLHHASFDLTSGQALRAPALDSIGCWRVERVGDTAYVRERRVKQRVELAQRPARERVAAHPDSVVIVGGGAAGLAAADTLRRAGYEGKLTMISADAAPPCDRPNLSKDYLAGTASEEWIPLRSSAYYTEREIELVLDSRVTSIDLQSKKLQLADATQINYGALLLATGADPVRFEIPGAQPSRVHYLRTLADSRAVIASAVGARRAVVIGASFIGLEVAASLRTRGLEVHVVGRESVPMERVLGSQIGSFVQSLHQSHGVVFHLGKTIERVEGTTAVLDDGTRLEADFIVIGAGVRPAIALAEQAGLTIDRGVQVDQYLRTSAPDVYAAGDIARWPDPHSGNRIRVEHWVVAQRQGQMAAMNMLGHAQAFDAVPFFWSQHYDVAINYVGHAENFDAADVDGSLEGHDCTVTYRERGRTLAVATISRDLESLRAERLMETTV
jgi:NADPH-dependent 2,4-dienoyl-CoA reductase/sulfur reductase-like enzyme/nitrite reductase/ring-hydroxylating ferredoxin subunit